MTRLRRLGLQARCWLPVAWQANPKRQFLSEIRISVINRVGMLAALSIVMGLYPNPRWLAIPVFLLIHTGFNLGAAMIVARLNDGFRDVAQIVPFLFRLGIYASGVMFPLDKIADRIHGPMLLLVELNPFAAYLTLYRWSFLGLPLTGHQLAVAIGWSVFALVWGFRFFRRAELRYGRG